MITDGTNHLVLGYDGRSASTHDQARPILRADNIVADLNNAGENYGILLIQTLMNDNATGFLAQSEDTVDGSAYVPFVRVVRAPLPSCAVLLVCGLVGILLPCARRKRK